MDGFEAIWKTNQEYVRRILLALTRDVDLAEDCLQDTYINARAGFAGYRGDGEKAWLGTIARNVYYGYARRKYFSSEQSLETADEQAHDSPGVDSDDRLALLTISDAMSGIDPILRKALIMKHYGGYEYEEIAQSLSCSPAMAKHRVWRAMQKLRIALGAADQSKLPCSKLRGPLILDWLYGALSSKQSESIESHVALCASCRKALKQVRQLSRVLDKAEDNYRILTLIDLDEQGGTTRYVWVKHVNHRTETMRTWRWNGVDGWDIVYLALQGEPVEVRWPEVEAPEGFRKFEGDLQTPVPPGEIVDAMFAACPPRGQRWDAREADGIWHYHHRHSPFPRREGLFIITMRLPLGARLVNADPAPDKTSQRTDRVSLTWRIITEVIPPKLQETKSQFEAQLQYKL